VASLQGMNVGYLLFVAAWVVAVVSSFFGIAEAWAVFRLYRWPFRAGLEVLSGAGPAPGWLIGLSVGALYETTNAKVRRLDTDAVAFREKVRIFRIRVHTPFALKSVIRAVNDQYVLEGRLPIGSSLFLAAWLCGWLTASIVMAPDQPLHGIPSNLLFGAFGVLFAGVLIGVSIPLELRRARLLAEEVLTGPPPELAA
jgi:hypothetical protein